MKRIMNIKKKRLTEGRRRRGGGGGYASRPSMRPGMRPKKPYISKTTEPNLKNEYVLESA